MTVTQVPAGPVRTHVQQLLGEGMSQAAICRAAPCSSSYLSALLHGQYNLGRTPQQTMSARYADRLLAVRYEEQEAPRRTRMCAPGSRFEPVGYRVGRCIDCGQLAPVQTRARDGAPIMFAHLRPEVGDADPGPLPAPAALAPVHADCGTPRGHQRHRRERTPYCEPCKAARRGYEQGWDAAMAKARRKALAIPDDLTADLVAFCRAFVLQPWPPGRPVSRARALAKRVVQLADAEPSAGGRLAA